MNRPEKSPMICLAFEFTSDRRSVAISDGDQRVLSQVVHDRGRTTPVFHLIDQALAEAQVARASIERLAISIGPGSYTGIRLAIAAAQGWHLATGVPVVAVDTFEALQRQTQRQAVAGPRVLCVNAQRQEFAVREWDGQGWAAPFIWSPQTCCCSESSPDKRSLVLTSALGFGAFPPPPPSPPANWQPEPMRSRLTLRRATWPCWVPTTTRCHQRHWPRSIFEKPPS